ncbi:MAG: hypothetical protein ACRDRK_18130, partial [Pseudonocardia sp.]
PWCRHPRRNACAATTALVRLVGAALVRLVRGRWQVGSGRVGSGRVGSGRVGSGRVGLRVTSAAAAPGLCCTRGLVGRCVSSLA